MTHKYNQVLPKEVEARLDAYIERIKAVQWFKPKAGTKKADIERMVNVSLDAFGVKAGIEFRSLKTENDYAAAWGAARDAAWGAALGAALGAADILVTDLDVKEKKGAFLTLVDLWEAGMYPCGVIDGKFVVYSPIDFEDVKAAHEVIIDGVKYVPAI